MEFFKEYNKQEIESSNNNLSVTKRTNIGYSCCYGALIIAKGIHKYEFKINHVVSDGVTIGIDKSTSNLINTGFMISSKQSYGYRSCGIIFECGKYRKYGDRFAKGDTIIMIVNLDKKTLSYIKNNKHQYDEIKIKSTSNGYKMAICTEYAKDSIHLISYNYVGDNINNENQNENNNETDLKYDALQIELNEAKKNEKLQKQENEELRQTKSGLSSQISTLNETVANMENEITQLKQELTKTKKENQKLQSDNDQLMDERKEFEIEINSLNSQIKELKLKNIDITAYENWNHEEILIWISSLEDGRYTKYASKLANSLKEEGLMGSDLVDVEESNLKSWGVINFRDRKDLLKKIKELTNKGTKLDNDMNHMNEGGKQAPTAYI